MNKHMGNLKLTERVAGKKEMRGNFHSVPNSTDFNESELAISQLGYKDLFDNMPNGCAYYKVIFDAGNNPIDLKYMKVNAAYAKNMGRSPMELIGKRVTEVFPHLAEDDFQWIEKYTKVALFGKTLAFTKYLNHLGKWYSVSAYCPEKGYVASILEDITERKKAETQKSENQKQVALIERAASLGALAAGVAHEINQPLQALKIMADGMIYWYDKGKETSMEKAIENCRRISVQAGYITAVVEWMQDFVNKAWSDTPEAVDLNKMLKQALSMVQERLRVHNIQLHENTCLISPIVWGDIRRLEEVIIIIVVNAIESLDGIDQAMKDIVITTSCVAERAVIEIRNNGPRIPDEIIEKIFQPFFSSAKSGANLGMGLAIVKSIVDAHNGIIQVFNFNQQVTFRIEFPLYVR